LQILCPKNHALACKFFSVNLLKKIIYAETKRGNERRIKQRLQSEALNG